MSRRSRNDDDLPEIVLGDAQDADVVAWGANDWQPRSQEADSPEVTRDRDVLGGGDYVGEVVANVQEWRKDRNAGQMLKQVDSASVAASSSLLPRRRAQVVQGTQIAQAEVLRLLCTPGFFARRAPLVLRPASLHEDAGEQVMTGTLRMPLRFRRRIQLRMYPTASGLLTVLELLPKRRWMPQTRRFLRVGVPAITRLTDRLEAAAG